MIDPILVWNIRGVGTSKGRLKTLISKWRPKIVALLEHFQNIDVAKRLGRGLRFDNFISNEAEGGKIWIFGDSIIEARLVRMGRQFISLKVGEGAEIFLLTIIYAKCTMVERRSLWDALSFQNRILNLVFLWVTSILFGMIPSVEEVDLDLFKLWKILIIGFNRGVD